MIQPPPLFLIVMAGGSGTRFWPKSTSKKPKQFLNFGSSSSVKTAASNDSHSLLSQTLKRFEGWIPESRRIIMTTQALRQAVSKEEPRLTVLAEPSGKNTAPSIYWAARFVMQQDPEGVMLVMPSDHYIARPEVFLKVVKQASLWALETDDLVTLGILPTRAETGYGYLHTEPLTLTSELTLREQSLFLSETSASSFVSPLKVKAFIEKPGVQDASQYIQSKNYYWNGGMFLWRAQAILKAYDTYMPEMSRAWNEAKAQVELAYPLMPTLSIDYGIMEKAKNVVMFPLECGWDDVGSWMVLETLADCLKTRFQDHFLGEGELASVESQGCIVDAPGKFVGLLGVKDLIVVAQSHCILVAHKSQTQKIRDLVEQVKKVRPDLV